MKKSCTSFFLLLIFLHARTQSVGIGTVIPNAKLHIKGSADTSQLVIDANAAQSNSKPLIRLRKSNDIDLMGIHSDDTSNVFIGHNTGRLNNPDINGGVFNTFTGSNSAFSNTSGYWNTAGGAKALYFNTTGFANTAHGAASLYSNTTGHHNTAAGVNALSSNRGGIENTGVGDLALSANTEGRDNTAAGFFTLSSNSTGDNNTSAGRYSLYSNITGSNNVAFGATTLLNNTIGNSNTASGIESMYQNTTGSNNTAIGYQALYKNTSGGFNTGIGFNALYYNTTGQQNLVIGNFALLNLLNSSNNTVVGEGAGSGTIYYMGWNNTLIGENSITDAPGVFNSIAIGKSSATTANNQARIGNSFITSIGGYTGWSNISDGRVKKNVQENVPGLSFISRLNPVTYTLNLNRAEKILQKPAVKNKDGIIMPVSSLEEEARQQKEQVVYAGFIAQDVEKAAKELGFNFSGIDTPTSENGLYGLKYEEFVVPLVKAAQELSARNEQLKKRNEEIKKRLEKLEVTFMLKNK
jgi:trimeric autotransporter adhesin